ncbi:MAG: hypothetical protein AMXMBFR7_31260 [Planctomycetota bacterium]
MEDYSRHVFICTSTTCAEGDPFALRLKLHQLLRDKLGDEYEKKVKLTKTLCLAQCGLGPNMVVYPEGVWYYGVKLRDIPEIVEQHLLGGKPVERLILHHLGKGPRKPAESA